MFPVLFALVAAALPTSDELVVHVVDAANQPVAGAWVACDGDGVGSEELRLASLRAWVLGDGTGTPQRRVRWTRTAADGSARLRPLTFWNDVVAITATGGAHDWVARGTAKELTLALHPHRFWKIRVVDPAVPKSRPHLPVMFGKETGGGRHDTSKFETVEEFDREGLATFGPIDLAIDPHEIDPILTASLLLPCLVMPRVSVPAHDVRSDPTMLEVPPHGRYEVQVVEEDGKPCERPVLLDVSTNEFSQLGLPGPYFGSQQQTLVNRHGTLAIDPVGLGLQLQIEAKETETRRKGVMRSRLLDGSGVVESLSQAGEVRVVRIDAPPPGCERHEIDLRGRAVDMAGAILADHQFLVELFDASETATLACDWDPVGSDGKGEFKAHLDVDAPPKHAATLLVFDAGPCVTELDEKVAVAVTGIEDVSAWRGGDLGEVKLTPIPVLLSGQVVDGSGQPLPGLIVAVDCDRKSFESDATIPAWWRSAYDHGGHRCDSDGRFEIHGFAGKQSWTVQSWQVAGQYDVPPEQPIVAGTRDLIIRRRIDDPRKNYGTPDFGPEGAIAGELLLDRDVPRSVVTVNLEPPGWKGESDEPKESKQNTRSRPWSLEGWGDQPPGDRFGSDSVPAGRWNLRVGFETLGQPFRELWRRDELEIKAGETLLVPPIDLRGRIKVARVEFVDVLGRPVPTGHVFCRERSQRPRKLGDLPLEELPDYGRFAEGRYAACAIDDWPTLEFLGYECRRISRRFEAPGSYVLHLPPRLKVRVELPAGLRLPPMPLTLDVCFNTDEILTGVMFIHGGEPPNGDSATFDESLGADVSLPAAAKYTLDLHVSHTVRSSGSSSWRGYNVIPQAVVHVADSDEVRVIRLPITQAQIDHAVKELDY